MPTLRQRLRRIRNNWHPPRFPQLGAGAGSEHRSHERAVRNWVPLQHPRRRMGQPRRREIGELYRHGHNAQPSGAELRSLSVSQSCHLPTYHSPHPDPRRNRAAFTHQPPRAVGAHINRTAAYTRWNARHDLRNRWGGSRHLCTENQTWRPGSDVQNSTTLEAV